MLAEYIDPVMKKLGEKREEVFILLCINLILLDLTVLYCNFVHVGFQ